MSQRDSEPSSPSADRVIAIGRATLRNVDFRKARFDRFELANCLFLSCDFRGVRLGKSFQPLFSARPRSYFRDCHFDDADLRRIDPGETRFEMCTFDDALLAGWPTEGAEFVSCRFAGSPGDVTFHGRPTGRIARQVHRKTNDFRDNDFIDVDIADVTFVGGIDLDAQRLPSSDDLIRLDRFRQRVSGARREISRWDYRDERADALAMLDALLTRYRDQDDVITPRVSKRGPSARVQIRVWSVLERMR